MGSTNGLLINIIRGIIGSFVSGFIAGLLGVNYKDNFNIVSLLIAIGVACLVIWLARRLRS